MLVNYSDEGMSFLRIRLFVCHLPNKVEVKVNIHHILTGILGTKISCVASCSEWCGQVVFNSTVALHSNLIIMAQRPQFIFQK